MAVLNFFDTYILMAIMEEVVPNTFFFRDRYFPTGEGDVFAADKVLTEYRRGDRKMAAFVSERIGDIPMDRIGYEIHELQPAFVGVSRLLTTDELKKRGFGEALYANSTPAQRAARLQRDDMKDMDLRIRRREEWMAVNTMLENACFIQEYVDNQTKGKALSVKFHEGTSDHLYTPAKPWESFMEMRADVIAMCRMLSYRGLPAADLLLGTQTADAIQQFDDLQRLLDKNSGIEIGAINEQLSAYTGVVLLGRLNFGGFRLHLISVDESYEDNTGRNQSYFPVDEAMVTAPNCGHFMYGQITQIDYGSTEYTSHPGIRVPKFSVKQDEDTRKLRLASRPLSAPKNYCPYIRAKKAVG